MALAILWGLASRKQWDANPHRMAQHQKQEKNGTGHSVRVGVLLLKPIDQGQHCWEQYLAPPLLKEELQQLSVFLVSDLEDRLKLSNAKTML